MLPVPWRHVASWNCTACGVCCKGFDVVLGFNEWLNLTRSYGVGVTQPDISKFYLRRRSDGSCVFLHKYFSTWLCGLQHNKPRACKLWPFKILDAPKFGKPYEACYDYEDRRFFIYVDPLCVGIRWGNPTPKFAYKTISELIEIALGLREKQLYSTAYLSNHSTIATTVQKLKPKLI